MIRGNRLTAALNRNVREQIDAAFPSSHGIAPSCIHVLRSGKACQSTIRAKGMLRR